MNFRYISWVILSISLYCQESLALDLNSTDNIEPRIDYDQWKPLGRGDPLKQDPTYDYVPPVLDRVHYWIDPVTNSENPSNKTKKNEVLLLGVISKKTTTPPPPTTISQIAESRKDLSNNFLKYLDNNNKNQVNYHRSSIENRLFSNFQFPLFTKPKAQHNEQRVPYTVLMPPPVVTNLPDSTIITTKSPTEFTIEPSQLIYQSSSSGLKGLTTVPLKFNEKIALHDNLQLPENFIKLQFNHDNNNNNRLLLEANSDLNVNYVTPPTLQKPEIMHKGHVSDENLENYVKIGRIEAQMQHDNSTKLIQNDDNRMMLISTQPVTLQTIKMKNLESPLVRILKNENFVTTPPTMTTMTESVLTTDPLFKHYKQPSEPVKGPLYLIIQGHSKVKTYGPSKQYYGIKIQEQTVNNNSNRNDKFNKDSTNKIDYRTGRSNRLQTLKHVIQTKLGAIDFNKIQQQNESQETELHSSYSIDNKDVSSEKYYKGYVADGRMIQNS